MATDARVRTEWWYRTLTLYMWWYRALTLLVHVLRSPFLPLTCLCLGVGKSAHPEGCTTSSEDRVT